MTISTASWSLRFSDSVRNMTHHENQSNRLNCLFISFAGLTRGLFVHQMDRVPGCAATFPVRRTSLGRSSERGALSGSQPYQLHPIRSIAGTVTATVSWSRSPSTPLSSRGNHGWPSASINDTQDFKIMYLDGWFPQQKAGHLDIQTFIVQTGLSVIYSDCATGLAC